MFDVFNRRINYLRRSITDKCNLRCRCCMPDGEIKLLPRNEILFLEDFGYPDGGINQGECKTRLKEKTCHLSLVIGPAGCNIVTGTSNLATQILKQFHLWKPIEDFDRRHSILSKDCEIRNRGGPVKSLVVVKNSEVSAQGNFMVN